MSHEFPTIVVDLIRQAHHTKDSNAVDVLLEALEEHGFRLEAQVLRRERGFLRDLVRETCEHDFGEPESTWLARVWTCRKCGQMQGQT